MKLNRWIYAAAGTVILLFAGLVYAWSVLSRPVAAYFIDWSGAQLSLTFTICMAFFCLGGFFAGVLSGMIHVKINMIISGVLFLIGFLIASRMQTLGSLYLGYGVLAGTASGFAYNTVIGTVTKFFPDKPGLISGILLLGFGMGSFVIGKVFQALTKTGEAFRASFLVFGIILCGVMLLGSLFIRKPSDEEIEQYITVNKDRKMASVKKVQAELSAEQMIRQSSFWFYFLWSIFMSAAGLALIAQAAAIVIEVNPQASAGTVSTMAGFISVFNGIGRVIFGRMYDKAGRAKTMLLVNAVFTAAVLLLILSMQNNSFSMLIIGFIASGIGYGGIPPTNSAIINDYFGKKNYPINFSIVNMSLLIASFGGTIAGCLYDICGSYFTTMIFMAGAIAAGSILGRGIKQERNMEYKNFNELIEKVKAYPDMQRMAVAAAGEIHTLEAALHAREEGIASPVLVGDKAEIERILAELDAKVPSEDIYDAADNKAAAELAVALVREGKADFLMKGGLDTGVILKAVVNKETGLGKGSVMSHFTIFDIPTYHKILVSVDGGMITYPTLEQKKAIIENTVGSLVNMGYKYPKVGVLTCVEKVNEKMPETVEAAALAQMNEDGEIKNCIVEGPISYDCAVDAEIARIKGYKSQIAGDVDVLVAPNIHAGNIMGKMLTCTCKAKMAGFVVGAKCPIVLTSRGSTAEEKYLSIVVSAVAANGAKT